MAGQIGREFYCFLCQNKHASEHEHKITSSRFPELLAQFGTEVDLKERLSRVKKIHICCLWLEEGHQLFDRVKFRSSPPNKSHAPRHPVRRESLPPPPPPAENDDISQVKSPSETFFSMLTPPNFHFF
jgi:hypothetical protein